MMNDEWWIVFFIFFLFETILCNTDKDRMWSHVVEQMITHNPATTRNLLLSFAQDNYCEKWLFWISLFADHTHYTLKKKPCCAENTQYPHNELLRVCKWSGCSSECLFLWIIFVCQDDTDQMEPSVMNLYSDLGHDVLKSAIHFIPYNDHHQQQCCVTNWVFEASASFMSLV